MDELARAAAGLSVYGWMVRAIVEFVQALTGLSGTRQKTLVQAMATAVAWAFVYVLGVKIDAAAMGIEWGKPGAVMLLAGSAMGMNDLLDTVAKLRRGKNG